MARIGPDYISTLPVLQEIGSLDHNFWRKTHSREADLLCWFSKEDYAGKGQFDQ